MTIMPVLTFTEQVRYINVYYDMIIEYYTYVYIMYNFYFFLLGYLRGCE